MDINTVTSYLEQNKNYFFPNSTYSQNELTQVLANCDNSFGYALNGLRFKDPSTLQIISAIVGALGVDRWMLGQKGLAVLKYFTFGGAAIWWIYDAINAKKNCRNFNVNMLVAEARKMQKTAMPNNSSYIDSLLGGNEK